MRKAFGRGSMGGGAGGSGSMLRSIGRVVTKTAVANGGALQEPFSSNCTSPTCSKQTQKPTSSSNVLSVSSNTGGGSPFSACNVPKSDVYGGSNTWPYLSSQCDEFEWVDVEDENVTGVVDNFVLGPVPSKDEVQTAVSAIQQVFDQASHAQLVRDRFASNLDKDVADQIRSATDLRHRVSSYGSESDWLEPSIHLCNPRMLQPHGFNRVYDAFHLLQTEPSVQRMVISLSSDKAVWDAVLNNDVVRELKESYCAAESNSTPGSSGETSDDTNSATNFVKWILDSTKAKFMDVIEKITKLVNELFKVRDDEETAAGATDPFEERLRSSFLLSVVVLLIVVASRAHRA